MTEEYRGHTITIRQSSGEGSLGMWFYSIKPRGPGLYGGGEWSKANALRCARRDIDRHLEKEATR